MPFFVILLSGFECAALPSLISKALSRHLLSSNKSCYHCYIIHSSLLNSLLCTLYTTVLQAEKCELVGRLIPALTTPSHDKVLMRLCAVDQLIKSSYMCVHSVLDMSFNSWYCLCCTVLCVVRNSIKGTLYIFFTLWLTNITFCYALTRWRTL